MQSEEQYNQLMLLYNQLLNGAKDISTLIAKEDYDNAITLIKNREQLFLNCKCINRYLELTPEQAKNVEKIVSEIKEIELSNMKKLEDGMQYIQNELAVTQKSQKIQQAYGIANNMQGSILNIKDQLY